jgi:hypothetical protein
MRRWILGSIVGSALAGFLPLPALAEQYALAAQAGGNGDGHLNNDDPSVSASFAQGDANGNESYEAGADLTQGGALYARASRSGTFAGFTGSPRAAASFSETIFIDEVPSGPITIRASFGVDVEATATGGFGAVASANAQLRLNAFAGMCTSAVSAHSVNGFQDLSTCSAADSSASAGGIELVVTPETLADFNHQIYIDGSVEAKMDGLLQNLTEGNASATGGAGFALARSPRGTEVVPGLVYIEIDPPTAHHFVNELTVFAVPEPGAPLLAAVGAATLAACRRRHAV